MSEPNVTRTRETVETETWELTDANIRHALERYVLERSELDHSGTRVVTVVNLGKDCSWEAEGKNMYKATVVLERRS